MIKMEESYGPLSEQKLRDSETTWGVDLPTSYRQFLLRTNGGSPEAYRFKFKASTKGSNIRFFLGVTDDRDVSIDAYLKRFKGRLPSRFFPIGFDSGGNLICISVSESDLGKIYFWDHELEADTEEGEDPETAKNTVLIADSFDQFLAGLQ